MLIKENISWVNISYRIEIDRIERKVSFREGTIYEYMRKEGCILASRKNVFTLRHVSRLIIKSKISLQTDVYFVGE